MSVIDVTKRDQLAQVLFEALRRKADEIVKASFNNERKYPGYVVHCSDGSDPSSAIVTHTSCKKHDSCRVVMWFQPGSTSAQPRVCIEYYPDPKHLHRQSYDLYVMVDDDRVPAKWQSESGELLNNTELVNQTLVSWPGCSPMQV